MKKIIALICILSMVIMFSVNAEENKRKTAKNYEYYMQFTFSADSDICTINGITRHIDENEKIVPYISEKTGDFMLPLRAVANFYELNVDWDSNYPNLVLLATEGKESIYESNKYTIYGSSQVMSQREIENDAEKIKYTVSPDLVIELHSGYVNSQGNVVSNNHSDDEACVFIKQIGGYSYNTTHMYSEIVNGRTFVPARSIANIFGFSVEQLKGKKIILTEIPDNELYNQKIECVADGNKLKITSYTKNNSLTKVVYNYPSSNISAWQLYGNIYNTDGEVVFCPEMPGAPGVLWTEYLLSGEEKIKSIIYDVNLEPGTYYYEAQEAVNYCFQFFRYKRDKETIRVYFDIK